MDEHISNVSLKCLSLIPIQEVAQQQDLQREPEQGLWGWTHIPASAWTSDCTTGRACGIFDRFYNTQSSNS